MVVLIKLGLLLETHLARVVYDNYSKCNRKVGLSLRWWGKVKSQLSLESAGTVTQHLATPMKLANPPKKGQGEVNPPD